MNIPGFSAETSLYKTSRHYRSIGKFNQADGTVYPALSINDLVKFSPDFYFDRQGWRDIVSGDISIRGCCRDCLSSFPCADESCRRQRLFDCNRKCNAETIGGCGCPPGRAVCEGLCCGQGEVCTLDGCSPPNQVCNNRRCLGRCLPEGCCPLGQVVCNNHCCERGWSCTSEGCCPPGVCCESTACPPGKFCCGGKVCCRDGADCRLVHGTSEYGCFR
jgi:hypothetical protein